LNALIKHLKNAPQKKREQDNKKLPLLSDTDESLQNTPLFFQITTKQTLTSDASPAFKPLTVPLPHSPYPSNATCLVITKDPHDLFASKLKGNPRVQQCIGMGAIRKTYNSYEQLRRLRDGEIIGEEPTFVLADERIVPSLPRVLGKAFYSSPRTTPISVGMKPSNVAKVVEEAFNKTYVRKSQGNCVVVRIGYLGMTVEELVENCLAMWERCVKQQKLVKKGTHGLRSGMIKSGSSVALPVWLAEELYSEEDVLAAEDVKPKKIKSKAERKLLQSTPAKEPEVAKEKDEGKKRAREDDLEKSFEERRARKLAKQEKATGDKTKKVVKA
jgi:ribosome biogenesis protein UTP30